MLIRTTRFGAVEVEEQDLILFPAGLVGLENCREWVLLADAQNDALGWLQSSTRGEVALAVVSPRRFVSSFQVRVPRYELEPLQLADVHAAHVLAVVGKNAQTITLNLKAPLVINLERRLGRQVVNNADYAVDYPLCDQQQPLRKSA